VEASVLRFWEKEFAEEIKPLKVGPRKRLYRPGDLEAFREIKRLLREEHYTIAGARRRLSSLPSGRGGEAAEAELKALKSVLAEIRRELTALRRFLAPAPGPAPGPGRTKNTGFQEKP
jgi:DNA-binding transcriptional MerR regulator